MRELELEMSADDTVDPAQDARLAEMVEELTGAEHGASLHAVREHANDDRVDALEVVARAMVEVDQPPPLRVSRALDGLGDAPLPPTDEIA